MNPQRKAIWEKSNGRCWYCGVELGEKGWHVDHFYPVRRNWWENSCLNPQNDKKANKVPSCASCNIQKGSLSIEAFREKIQGFVRSLNNYHNQYIIAKKYGLIKETNRPVKFWFEENIRG